MQYVGSGNIKTLSVDFKSGPDMVVPDPNSVTLTVSRNDGIILSGYDSKNLATTDTQSSIAFDIDGTANTKTMEYEFREVTLNYTVNSTAHNQVFYYVLTDDIKLPIAPEEVRTLLGVSSDELPDDRIDMVSAYHRVKEDVDTDIDLAFTSGDSSLRYVIEAIKLQAALTLVNTLELIATQSQQADNTMFRRFEKVDFKAIKSNLNYRYSEVTNTLAGTNEASLTYSTLAQGTDAVTGA